MRKEKQFVTDELLSNVHFIRVNSKVLGLDELVMLSSPNRGKKSSEQSLL